FGVAIETPEGKPASFVFSGIEGFKMPWVALGGHPYNVLQLQAVEVRPDLSSVHFNNPMVGDLVSSNGQLYMKEGIQRMYDVTINVQTGKPEPIPLDKPFASFSRWSAGVVRDGKWVMLFEYPKSILEAPLQEDD